MALKKRTFRSFSPPFDKSVGNNDRVKSVQFNLGTISATVTRDIFRAKSEVEIKQISLVSDTALAASDSAYYTFDVKNKTTSSQSLFSTPPTTQVTGGTAIAADTNYNLTPNQYLFLNANDVLQLVVTKTGSPAALGNVMIIVDFEITGQTTTTSTSTSSTTTTSTSTSSTTTTTTTTTVTTSTTVT